MEEFLFILQIFDGCFFSGSGSRNSAFCWSTLRCAGFNLYDYIENTYTKGNIGIERRKLGCVILL